MMQDPGNTARKGLGIVIIIVVFAGLIYGLMAMTDRMVDDIEPAAGNIMSYDNAAPDDAVQGSDVENAMSDRPETPDEETLTEPFPTVPDRQAQEETQASCDFDDLIGMSVEEAEARLNETGRPYRILPPGSMYSQDYLPDRINLNTDGEGAVRDVWCG